MSDKIRFYLNAIITFCGYAASFVTMAIGDKLPFEYALYPVSYVCISFLVLAFLINHKAILNYIKG